MCKTVIYLFVSLFIVCLYAGVATADLQEGLVSHWMMDEGAGDIAHDSGGISDGQLVGSANWAEGYLNEGVNFLGYNYKNGNGSLGYIACPSNPAYTLTRAITLSCWVKPDDNPNQSWNWMVLRGGIKENECYGLAWIQGSNEFSFKTTFLETAKFDAQGNHIYHLRGTIPNSFFDGGWHHVAGTYDGTTRILYMDGQELSRYELVATIEPGTGRIMMGAGKDQETPHCATQVLDDVRIYDRGLTPEEVQELASADQVYSGKATHPTPIDRSMIDTTSIMMVWWWAFKAENVPSVAEQLYMGTNRAAVEAGDPSTNIDSSLLNRSSAYSSYNASGLIPGSTYYWRADEIYADGQVVTGYIWQFTVTSKKATNPVPADGAKFVDPNSTLSWTAGLGATSHMVHIGKDRAAVASAATADGVALTEPNYVPGVLDFDTTYFWRVDEVGAEGTFVGDVWSLTAAPDIPVTDPTLVGYWTLDDTPDGYIVDSSGYHHHGKVIGDPALVADDVGGKALEFNGQGDQFCRLGDWLVADTGLTIALRVKWAGLNNSQQGLIAKRNTWNDHRWTFWADENGTVMFDSDKTILNSEEKLQVGVWEHWAVTTANGSDMVIYRNGSEVARNALGIVGGYQASALLLGVMEAVGDGGRNAFNGALDDVRLYDRVLTVSEIQQLGRRDMNQAWNPTPASGPTLGLALGQNTVPLSWAPGDMAAQHRILFGSEPNALVEVATVAELSIVSPVVDINNTYFWRVDEINTDSTVTEGNLWNFTTHEYFVVDDFESYNDIESGQEGSNLVYLTWIDGYVEPPDVRINGSTIGHTVQFEASMETSIVYDGSQSTPLYYDNSVAAYSEVTAYIANQPFWASTLPIGPDWTKHGVQTLTLWFYGDADNAVTEQMYVKVNGVKMTYPGDAADIATPEWKPWNVDLAAFGVDLSNVTQLSIGFERTGVSGGSGTVFIDDILLYRSVPSVASEEI